MALKIIDKKIVGEIYFLEEKLEGKIPVDRLELLYLVNSWGRNKNIYIEAYNDNFIEIKKCKPNECYDLSKLDTSEIINMKQIFMFSNFNGDISNWNTSNVKKMNELFHCAIKFNGNINSWDTSKVTNMYGMFFKTELFNSPLNNWNTSNVVCTENMFWNAISFDQNISSWNLENAVNCYCMFLNANAFMSKYNSGEDLSYYTDEIKEWLINNREKMSDIDLKDKYGKEIDMFFNKFTDINSINKI